MSSWVTPFLSPQDINIFLKSELQNLNTAAIIYINRLKAKNSIILSEMYNWKLLKINYYWLQFILPPLPICRVFKKNERWRRARHVSVLYTFPSFLPFRLSPFLSLSLFYLFIYLYASLSFCAVFIVF